MGTEPRGVGGVAYMSDDRHGKYCNCCSVLVLIFLSTWYSCDFAVERAVRAVYIGDVDFTNFFFFFSRSP